MVSFAVFERYLVIRSGLRTFSEEKQQTAWSDNGR
jgi:hypothetical protein